MSQLTAIYLALTVGVFLTCMLAHRLDRAAEDVFTAATVVLLFASLSVVVRMWVPAPWSQAGNPVQDILCLAMFAGAYEATRARWAAALAIMFLIQLGVHAGYWIAGDFSDPARRMYAFKNNTIYCGELAVIFLTGGGYVVRHRRRLAGLPGPRDLAHSSRAE